VSLLFLAVLGPPTLALSAQSPTAAFDERAAADFYRGKIVRIVVGFPPGGGADVYSRLIARHLGRFIPGNPTLAVSNMPGKHHRW
jgi:tripartite-type tricarboxylate transporter receptor subunit TctC